MSQAVHRIGRKKCELCGRSGTDKNPLTRHHVDGNNRNNDQHNFLVVHNRLCHPFADFIAQFHLHHGKKATRAITIRAWHTFTWKD